MKTGLPPEELPPLGDPAYGGEPGPYSASGLRTVCGSRINPDAIRFYRRRSVLTTRESIRSCAHPDIEPWIGNVGGFDPHVDVVQPPRSQWPISGVVARVDARSGSMPFELPEMTYFVDYSSFHSNPAELPSGPMVETIKERLFPEGARLVLTFYNDMRLKHSLWTHMNFFEQPFLDQFDATLLPDFSAYCNDTTPQYLIGERQLQIFGTDGSRQGRTVIPSIVWSNEESLRRQADLWLSQYPKVHTIRLDCYGKNVDRVGWAWRHLFAMEKYFKGFDHIHWIIAGMTSGWMIRELNRIFPKGNYSIVAPVNMFIAAQRGSTDPIYSAQEFRRQIAKLEDFRSGRDVADAQPRPDHWPTYSEVDTAGFSK